MVSGPGGSAVRVFASLIPDASARPLLRKLGGSWEPVAGVRSTSGQRLASLWRSEKGSVFLPFDPDQAQLNFLSERYRRITGMAHSHAWQRPAMRLYYRSREAMPRPVQIWLRRRYSRLQARTRFPSWPVETGVHDLLELVLSILESIAQEPVPRIAPWPRGARWALVLTHDVETAAGVDAMGRVLELEHSLGLRSCWNFVPRRYDVSDEVIQALRSEGFEVGVHGLYHDGRDLESAATLRERLPGMHEAAARWGAHGFRSPSTHRDWELMPLLGFEYDSSYPDTDPFEPQGGGCCTWLPFFNGEMVELPMTMAQDHTLFEILRHPDERVWVQKAEYLRSRGGMALLDTHPDYLIIDETFAAYRRFLERFGSDSAAWRARPGDVSAWWRRRAASQIERLGASWTVTGPAAREATIELTSRPCFSFEPRAVAAM
jgi:hypothetical protein